MNDKITKHEAKERKKRHVEELILPMVIILLAILALMIWYRGSRKRYPNMQYSAENFQAVPVIPVQKSCADSSSELDTESKEIQVEERNGTEELVYTKKKNDRMEIALTFDDGPHPRYTPQILEILEEYGIKATFFMVGENIKYYPKAAQAVINAGHEVENHSFSHIRMGKLNSSDMRNEIGACEKAISSLTPYKPRFLRPPEGQMSQTLRNVIRELEYRVVLWDLDTRDWEHTPPDIISQNILSSVEAGDIILMHDFIGKNSPTPAALRIVIPALLEKGYKFVTVGELIDGAVPCE